MSSGSAINPERLVYRWDLDKTYLRTEFDTVADLVRTAIEPPSRKRTVPGAAALLRELRRTRPRGIHILSGSPEQMRSRLEAKLRLDGVVWDRFTLKPTLENVLRGRFGFVREQLGYKLRALLESRANGLVGEDEILFGDDAEADGYIYSLYADLLAGRVDVSTLLEVLGRANVHADDVEQVVRLAGSVPRADAVRKIFIHLERVSASTSFDAFGHRVCAFFNYFQPALVLVDAGVLGVDSAMRVATELVVEHGFDADALLASHADLVSRKQVGGRLSRRFVEARAGFDARSYEGASEDVARTVEALAAMPPSTEEAAESAPHVDYLALFDRDRARAAQGKARARWRKPRA